MAISLTLRRAHQFIKNSMALISTDNTTVVAYLNRQRGGGGGGTFTRSLYRSLKKLSHVSLEPRTSSDKANFSKVNCSGRSNEQNNQTDLIRMGSQSIRCKRNLSNYLISKIRPVCNWSKWQNFTVRITDLRQKVL